MCGIAGVISLRNDLQGREKEEVNHMLDMLRHRGPDGRGLVADERCILGNTRLKIIDLTDNAHMPMSNEDASIWITYNGEVSNYQELRAEYGLDKKHRFKSTSDTEVLIHLYEELGISFLKTLSGMFAFCLLDKRRQKAYIVRDYFGTRPLFYYLHEGRIYFASEIKAFLEIPSFKNDLNHEGLSHYFSLAYIPDTMTPFTHIHELQGAHLIEIDLQKNTHTLQKYYDITYPVDSSISYAQAQRSVHAHLADALRRNMISDAPLGLTLSGGVDTSALLALAKEAGRASTVHTYSIKMGEASFDESYYQKIMVDFAKPVHHEIVVTPEKVLEKLEEHMVFMDEPSGDGAAIPSYLLAEEAKKEVKVLISGEGGDEIFHGYETHRAHNMRKLYRRYVPGPVQALLAAAAMQLPTSYKKLSFDFLAKRFTEGSRYDVPGAHYYWRHVLDEKEKRELLPSLPAMRATDALFRDLFNRLPFREDLHKIGYIDIVYYFIGDLMVKNDRTFMAHSVEARFPYMDRLLVEHAHSLPTAFKTRGLQGRCIQKDALKDILPREIYNRSNMGLEMPHAIWFMREFKSISDIYFTKKKIEQTGLLSYRKVRSLWDEHMQRRRDNGRTLWCVLTFIIWFDLFVASKRYQEYL